MNTSTAYPLPNLPARNCIVSPKTYAHVKPFRKDITPEEQERLRVAWYDRQAGIRDRQTNELREGLSRRATKAHRTHAKVRSQRRRS